MRPENYPYRSQRYQETIVSETRLPYSNERFGIIGIKDTYTGKIVEYRRFTTK